MDSRIIGQFKVALGNLDAILGKAADNAAARGFSPDAFLAIRLAPDMFNLTRQIQICCDVAKATAGNLARVEAPRFEDTETTVAELRARIGKTIAFLASIPDGEIDACDPERMIPLTFPAGKAMRASVYLYGRQLGNFYFHLTTAYALLRHSGVPIGKGDYLGQLELFDA